MKKLFFCLMGLCLSVQASAQRYSFDHGPYLQELTEDGATFVFTTSAKGVSWVELRAADGTLSRHYALEDGLRDAYTTFNAVRVENLSPATRYEYRLGSKEIVDFQPYKVTFGDSIVSRWYAFSTSDPHADRCSFIALSDMHQQSEKLGRLLSLADVESADRVFYVGDMMDYYADERMPFESFIDKSVEMFATERPFVLVRGNHETRGDMARSYARYAPNTSGKYYGAYRIGDVMFVVLDCGEDKPDDFWVYAGLTDFDAYRTEQAEWFAELIRSKEYRSARWHVVMNHFPPLSDTDDGGPEGHGVREITSKFLPLYRKAGIDLMISGHMHRYQFLDPAERSDLNFPVIVNSTESVVRADIDGRTMKVCVRGLDGETLKEFTVSR